MKDGRKVLVSCIVPIYNASEFLNECIESLVYQTLKDIEIILIDDGSTDTSPEICKAYSWDERIIYKRKENGGASSARNLGLSIAQGEYLLFVDADDFVESELCEKAYKAAKEYNADICMWDYFRNGDTVTYTHGIQSGLYVGNQLQNIILPMSVAYVDETGKGTELMWNVWLRLYKKSLVDENQIRFDERFPTGEDMLFTLQATLVATSLYYFLEWRPYHYRAAYNSLTSGYVQGYWEKRTMLIAEMYSIIEGTHRVDLKESSYLRAFLWTIIAIRNEFKNYCHRNRDEVIKKLCVILDDPIHETYYNHIPLEKMDAKFQYFYQCIYTKDVKQLLDTFIADTKLDEREHKKRKARKWIRSRFGDVFHHKK